MAFTDYTMGFMDPYQGETEEQRQRRLAAEAAANTPVKQTIVTQADGSQEMTIKGTPEALSSANPNTPTVTGPAVPDPVAERNDAAAVDAQMRAQAQAQAPAQTKPKAADATTPKAAPSALPPARFSAKVKAFTQEFGRAEISPAEAEERRLRLRNLLILGNSRGYLTHAELNDTLPDEMQDAELLTNIFAMIKDMGIQMFEDAGEAADTLAESDATPQGNDVDIAEQAEIVISTVDSALGRTTDPVRMYMREMGATGLLTPRASPWRWGAHRETHRGRPQAHGASDLRLPEHNWRDPRAGRPH